MSNLLKAGPSDVAPGLDDVPILHVVFRLADAEYALPADVVVQMEEYTGASPVPGSPDFVSGVMQLRGKVVPVVDLRKRFGLPPRDRDWDRDRDRKDAGQASADALPGASGAKATPGSDTRDERRVVVGEIGDRRVALTVDSAREVVRLRPSQLKPPPKLLEADARGFVRSVVHDGNRLILVLDFAKIIGEEAIDGGH